MPIYSFDGRKPAIEATAYVSPTATVIGRVTIGARCYIGHGAILRGDYGSIEIGEETAIEEGVIVHARPEDWTRIGRRVTLGHGAMVHNATILDGAVIGMRAVVSDFSEVGEGAIVGEMGLVKNGQKVPAGKVAVGVPVRVIADVDERHRDMTVWAKALYVALAERYSGGALVELPAAGRAGLPALVPIGVLHTPLTSAQGAPAQGRLRGDLEGEILLDAAYAEGLADLDGFSHLILLYLFHEAGGFKLRVTPYLDTTPRGLFATRAPSRPNPIGLTVVRLLGVEGSRLRVAGVDMLDATPLLDIKPYVPAFDAVAEASCGWLEPRLREVERGERDPVADGRFHAAGERGHEPGK
jgi:tRNA (adenine37-N6)-methyltransferase